MCMRKLLTIVAILFGFVGITGPANAALVFVGSWQVDQGPSWDSSPLNGPLAYTGQEAAALLFGGTAADYSISTVDSDPLNIDFNAWYSIIGYSVGVKFDQNYTSKYLGQYYGPTSGYPLDDINAAASAYISDNAIGAHFTNFAFINADSSAVPEPAALALFGMGLLGLGLVRRKR